MTPSRAEPAEQHHTTDAFLDGLVTLLQPRGGHRAGLDAALLQALVPAGASGEMVDLGTGVGTIAFAVAARAPALAVTAVEQDEKLVGCARAALALPQNAGFAARIRLVQADVSALGQAPSPVGLARAAADFVLMNPPYDEPHRVRPSPDSGRRGAHIGEAGLLGVWCRAAAALLKPGGCIGVIHRATALPPILEALGTKFGEVAVLPVHPFTASAASRVVVRARKARRGPLRIMPGLVLHEAGGGWTEPADAILRGRAELPI